MTEYSIALFEQHAQMLAASRITPEHAAARGYVSVDTKRRLEQLNVTKTGRNVPGLLVPSLRKDGSTWGYQYRPDGPRLRDGKPVKYETPVGQRNGIDVPPGVGPLLDDPAVQLWITEGVKKADAAAVRGLACVALPGVWSWRGTNSAGGKTAVADWHDVALDGRQVVLAFDSDAVRKKAVSHALAELARYLESKGSTVSFLHLPDDDDGKTGLDDYLADHDVEQLHRLVRPDAPAFTEPSRPPASSQPAAPSPSPGRPAEDGAVLLDGVAAFISRFVAFPSADALTAVVLWVVHTHMVGRFDSTPRLALLSPEKQSGKTRTLELVELLSAGAEFLMGASASFIFRLVGAEKVTVLLDECDTIWSKKGGDETAEALRGIVNSGHRKGATVGRVEMVGQKAELRRFPVYAPVALAGIGNLPDTILDRSVIVRMRRRAPDEQVEPYRERTGRPIGEALRERLTAWASSVADKVGCPWPDMPAGVADRPADVWEPLLMVADLAGGHWPERARTACTAFVTGSREDTASLGVRLLTDLFDVFRDGADLVAARSTDDILTRLCALDEAPWGDMYGKPLDSRGLAKKLKPYEVTSTKVRIGEHSVRGYRRTDLWDAWSRYGVLSNLSGTSGTSGTPLASPVPDVPDVPDPFETEEPPLWPDSESSPVASSVAAPSAPVTSGRSSGSTTAASPAPDASQTDTTSWSATPSLDDYLKTKPGRCAGCGWHIETQGHRSDCERTQP